MIAGRAQAVLAWAWSLRGRFVRFGIVGLSGVAVNQLVLWLCLGWVLAGVPQESLRLNGSIAVAILFSMTGNFLLNRRWTWGDRARPGGIARQYAQYALANWVGIAGQVVGTNLLAQAMPVMAASIVSIGVASVANFLLNDLWTFRHVRVEGADPEREALSPARTALAVAVLGLLLALSTYLTGLGSIHILRNGDEMVYAQIARATAAGGEWLPLKSGMPDMVNTKPPMIFWQAMLSTDWGDRWSLLWLRLPSVGWTLATALLTGLLAWRLAGRSALTGISAALAYLAFFSTYRYGRPFLTNAPETFWSFSCCAVMLWWRPIAFRSGLLFPLVVGLLAGLALLTKSFAQLAPIGLALAWMHWKECEGDRRRFLLRSVPALAVVGILSLAIFSLWFILDPDPAAIWREFVVKENLGKVDRGSYLRDALWGGSSILALGGSFFVNAGFLAFPLFGVVVESIKRRASLSTEERRLWAWVVIFFLVFCIPSQRSGRYLLEAMPAVAILMAIRWRDVGRNASQLSLAAVIAVLAGIGWVAFHLARQAGWEALPWWLWPVILTGIALSVLAWRAERWTATAVAPATMFVYLAMSGFLAAFDPPAGAFDEEAIRAAEGRPVWVPENFRSVAEIERFLLPGADVRGFPERSDPPPETGEEFVIVATTLDAAPPAGAVGSRLDITSRHSAEQIREMAAGKVQEHLFRRLWLVRRPR